MGRNDELVHEIAKKSWWSGRITALCGATAEAGTYETSTWRLFGLPGKKCPACKAVKEGART
ncbi:MAG TPA: hypothetical protein VJ870_18520 [Amycolatopsis sp.]|nr:hypothetical protein [Amycolatopsis sp.]